MRLKEVEQVHSEYLNELKKIISGSTRTDLSFFYDAREIDQRRMVYEFLRNLMHLEVWIVRTKKIIIEEISNDNFYTDCLIDILNTTTKKTTINASFKKYDKLLRLMKKRNNLYKKNLKFHCRNLFPKPLIDLDGNNLNEVDV